MTKFAPDNQGNALNKQIHIMSKRGNRAEGMEIVFEDDWLIVVNKPSGLLTMSTGKGKEITAYSMLMDYPNDVTIKIDGIAASAASVIAMAGNKVLMSPVSMMMIHNPATGAFGDHTEFSKVIEMLDEVKESIINAYVIRTGLSRTKLAHLMDSETWMNANKAIELGFADDVISDGKSEDTSEATVMFSRKAVNNALFNKVAAKVQKTKPTVTEQAQIKEPEKKGHSVDEIMERLNTMKKFM